MTVVFKGREQSKSSYTQMIRYTGDAEGISGVKGLMHVRNT